VFWDTGFHNAEGLENKLPDELLGKKMENDSS